jgi:hypothetical protein
VLKNFAKAYNEAEELKDKDAQRQFLGARDNRRKELKGGGGVKIIDFPQGSAEWAPRVPAASPPRMCRKVLSRAKDRKSEGATRANYKAQIIAEILTGKPQEDDFTSDDMEGGIENEPFARGAYEVHINGFVDQVGFVVHPRYERAGCSPDGLVGDKGMVQIKCPKPATHIAYRLAGVVPSKYEPQLALGDGDCCEREWSDFVSYCPAFPAPINLFVVRCTATRSAPRSPPRSPSSTARWTRSSRSSPARTPSTSSASA